MALRTVGIGFGNNLEKQEVNALYQEMKVLRQLNHKHIVKCYGMLRASDSVSLLMEYVKGGSIRSLILRQGALQENVISKFCQQILKALVYLHEKKIVHRDVKCSNILLDDSNHCKLTGFSLSKYDENITSLSGCWVSSGAIYWMSPEVIQRIEYGSKADIWSFGCTVLEMLNTKPPYWEWNPHVAAFKIAADIFIPAFPAGTTDHCMEFVKECLQKNPQDRPSAKDLPDFKFISLHNQS